MGVLMAHHYVLWPFLTLAVLALWVAAMLDINRHRRGGTFTGAGLLCMAGCVSVVTIVAVAGIGATFAPRWFEVVSKVGSDGFLEDGGPAASSYVFSFGLEKASSASPVEPTGMEEHRDGAPR